MAGWTASLTLRVIYEAVKVYSREESMKGAGPYKANNFPHSQYFLRPFITNCLALESRLIKGVKYIFLSSV